MTSFIAQVKTPGDTDWVGNGLRFGTKGQAESYIKDLAWRWTAVQETRVAPSDDEPTHIFINGETRRLP
tara:strand:+ start:316 stop:522 length:207 start_codon:yes stop_codon:yes gene_type:complete